MFFSSQPMGSARSSRENATLRVELQENRYFKEGAPWKSVSSASRKDESHFLVQNHGSVRLMGLGSRGFLPLTRKLPQIVVQRGSPHDLIRNVQNELDSALFCKVLGHQAKTYFSVPSPWIQLAAARKMLLQGSSSRRTVTLRRELEGIQCPQHRTR